MGSVRGGVSFEFLSTLSLRRATRAAMSTDAKRADFYPRSPCGERLPSDEALSGRFNISIHALLAESDVGLPRGRFPVILFLSTLSLRRAT